MRFRVPAHRVFVVAISAALLLAACGGDEDAPAEEPAPHEDEVAADDLTVVATTSILGDITEQLLGEDGDVEVIIPPGSDPHGYEPSARDAATLREADLVVANGLQLEEGLMSALAAAEEDGARVLEVAPHLDPIAFDWDGPHDHGHGDEGDEGHAHEDEGDDGHSHGDEGDEGHAHEDEGDDGHAHGPEDPHVWHDPLRMVDAVHLIASELADVAEVVDADEWEARAHAYEQDLLTVHEDVEAILAEVPEDHRQLITNHDSFGYLAVRYDFEVIGTVIPGSSTDVETDPAAFADLIATLEEARVPAIFSENTEADRLSEQLASEVLDRADLEVEVVELYSDSLGEPGSDGESYLDLLRSNAERIAAGLS